MPKRLKSIPVNPRTDTRSGVSIQRITAHELPHERTQDARRAHREDAHSFYLLEKGSISLEIDFQTFTIGPSTLIYLHPNQVHRILSFEQVTVSSWSIDDERLTPEYLQLLEDMVSLHPIVLAPESCSLLVDAVSLCIRLAFLNRDRLYPSLLQQGCNTLVALVITQFTQQQIPVSQLGRTDAITKNFKRLLAQQYTTLKKTGAYAEKLNVSPNYLNECVKQATGHSVSYHIQQRLILEAKRLLVHSDQDVKEIAAKLGFDDYAYFSRVFTKATGVTALHFRRKNVE